MPQKRNKTTKTIIQQKQNTKKLRGCDVVCYEKCSSDPFITSDDCIKKCGCSEGGQAS